MTETRGPDRRLADAFQAIEDSSGSALPDDLRDRIWLAVSGVLPPEQRRELVDMTARDPACAEAWRVANEMWRASQGIASDTEPGVTPSRARRWTASWLAAAAVLLVGTTVGLVTLRDRRAGDEFRTATEFVVESLVAETESLPRESFRLRWAPGPAGSRYRIRVTTDDLTLIAMADIDEAEFRVAPTLLSRVPEGAVVLWQVEAHLPDGQRVTSPTFGTGVR